MICGTVMCTQTVMHPDTRIFIAGLWIQQYATLF
jgi:hypothetical protein